MLPSLLLTAAYGSNTRHLPRLQTWFHPRLLHDLSIPTGLRKQTRHLAQGTSLLTGSPTPCPEGLFPALMPAPAISHLAYTLSRPSHWHLVLLLLKKPPASEPFLTPHSKGTFQNHLPPLPLWPLTAHHTHLKHTPAQMTLRPLAYGPWMGSHPTWLTVTCFRPNSATPGSPTVTTRQPGWRASWDLFTTVVPQDPGMTPSRYPGLDKEAADFMAGPRQASLSTCAWGWQETGEDCYWGSTFLFTYNFWFSIINGHLTS